MGGFSTAATRGLYRIATETSASQVSRRSAVQCKGKQAGGKCSTKFDFYPCEYEFPSFPTERSFGVRAACCRFPPRKLACGNLSLHAILYSLFIPTIMRSSQQAAWGESGSKLHALQSFAPYAMRHAQSRKFASDIGKRNLPEAHRPGISCSAATPLQSASLILPRPLDMIDDEESLGPCVGSSSYPSCLGSPANMEA